MKDSLDLGTKYIDVILGEILWTDKQSFTGDWGDRGSPGNLSIGCYINKE